MLLVCAGGYIEDLDKAWIWKEGDACPEDTQDSSFSKRLGLRNLEGIFIMIAGGVLSGIFLVLAEILYDRWSSRTKQEEEEVGESQERKPNSGGDGGGGYSDTEVGRTLTVGGSTAPSVLAKF